MESAHPMPHVHADSQPTTFLMARLPVYMTLPLNMLSSVSWISLHNRESIDIKVFT